MSRAVLFLAAGLLLATACSGSSGEEASSTAEPIANRDLAIMALPLDVYGEQFAAFEVDTDSGFDESKDVADDTIDPEDTATEIEDAGWQNSYGLGFNAANLGDLGDAGVLSVSSQVYVFQDDDSASAFLSKQFEDYERLVGSEVEAGIVFTSSDLFEVNGLANEARGAVLEAAFGSDSFHGIEVAFRSGSLLGVVDITSNVPRDTRGEVIGWAEALSKRINAVMAGTVDELPVPLPEDGDGPGTGAAPSEGPIPEKMVLALGDLPEGVQVDEEGYTSEAPGVYGYKRNFDTGVKRIGESTLLSLQTGVRLYDVVDDAGLEFKLSERLVTDEGAQRLFAAGMANTIGAEPRFVTVTELDSSEIGDESVAGHVLMDTDIGQWEMIFYYVRVGRAFDAIIGAGLVGDVHQEDIHTLAQKVAERTAAELAAY